MTFLDRDLRGNDFVTDYEKNACRNWFSPLMLSSLLFFRGKCSNIDCVKIQEEKVNIVSSLGSFLSIHFCNKLNHARCVGF